jgi:hypothetical protein
MASLAPYLVSQGVEQPQPRFVPRPNTPHVRQDVPTGKIRVQLRGRERPKHLLLGTINHCDFRVVKAIPLHIDVRGETVIASWRQIDEFGTGPHTSLACDDLGHTVAELYNSLQADEARLGPDLVKVWNVLREHIVRR